MTDTEIIDMIVEADPETALDIFYRCDDHRRAAYWYQAVLTKPRHYYNTPGFGAWTVAGWTRGKGGNLLVQAGWDWGYPPGEVLYPIMSGINKKYLMDAANRRGYNRLPQTITIYRGEAVDSEEVGDGLSWTLDIDQARWFADNHSHGPRGRVVKGIVTRGDILWYDNDRQEQEIVTKWDCLNWRPQVHEIEIVGERRDAA